MRLGLLVSAAFCIGCTSATSGIAQSVSTNPSRPFDVMQRPYTVDREGLSFTPLAGAQAYTGITKSGSGWRMEVPDNWNGGLLVYVRGGAQPGEKLCDPVTHANCVLPDAGYPEIRTHLLQRGFAWVSPTFREYRMTPRVRALDALEVAAAVRAVRPDKTGKTYIMGNSMGGFTVQHTLEMFPGAFDGGIAGCVSDTSGGPTDFYEFTLVAMGLVAPQSPEIADYLRHAKFPLDLVTLERLGPKILALLGPDFPFVRNAAGDALMKIMETRTGGARPMFHAGFFAAGQELIPGYLIQISGYDAGPRPFIDNHSVDYRWLTRSEDPPAPQEVALNRAIPRFTCDPSVCSTEPTRPGQTHNLGGSYVLTGKTTVPMITINTLGDMRAFYAGARRYYQHAQEVGAGQLIVHRAIRDKRHCGFKETEMSEAFDDLDKWVRDGKRPAGDNPLDKAAFSSPSYGCRFTRGAHDQDWSYETDCGSIAQH